MAESAGVLFDDASDDVGGTRMAHSLAWVAESWSGQQDTRTPQPNRGARLVSTSRSGAR